MTTSAKVTTRDELKALVKDVQKKGKKVGFTSGTFDLLHAGHVEYLEESRRRCDILVVGINTDASVKSYKSKLRPIVDEASRAHVMAGLSSVDYVFLFDETNNNQNITELKPDIYFKAGDYKKEQLSSAPLVEAYGGRVEVIPFKKGHSSTGIIEKISQNLFDQITIDEGAKTYEKAPAVFLDRDGTLIHHVEYLHEAEKLKLFDDTAATLKRFKEAGYRLVIVTNQPGIGLGYFTREDFFVVNRKLLKSLVDQGIMVDRVFFCPHSLAESCECKKPGIQMFERAAKDLNLDLSKSFMIGDHEVDIGAAKKLGIKSVLIDSSRSKSWGETFRAANLTQAADFILDRKGT